MNHDKRIFLLVLLLACCAGMAAALSTGGQLFTVAIAMAATLWGVAGAYVVRCWLLDRPSL